ncbi:MAG TPA: fibronectin type III domain-containing protein, partial [Pseudobacteroides sp.]|uniref:fibronectin type III domain-containing protein n=1 Tax=Pseudobacteroides sp. TaxID=1968840 RepID=UPI002F9424AF
MRKNIKRFTAYFLSIILVFGQISDLYSTPLVVSYDQKGVLADSPSSINSDKEAVNEVVYDSVTPSVAVTPTYINNTPTAISNNTPTTAPSTTLTTIPTIVPTNTPTSMPTNSPVDTPTNLPANTPTSIPTIVPTNLPTNTPQITSITTPTETSTSSPTNSLTVTPTPLPQTNINSDIKLEEDKVYGNLSISGGTLDLNGHKLTVLGSIAQTGGTMLINGGSLDVAGDYKLQNGNYNCWAVLKMNNEADYVKVEGSFATYSSYNDSGYFTAGTLEIKGDFTQKNTNYSSNFNASGTHKTILSGSGVQKISFENPGNSTFNVLDMNTASKVSFVTPVAARRLDGLHKAEYSPLFSLVNTTVKVDKDMTINSGLILSNSSIDFGGVTLIIKGDLALNGGTIDVSGGKLDINGNLNISGGTLDLKGRKATVSGNVSQTGGTMLINGGSLDVAGDYKLQNGNYNCWAVLKMNNEADYVKVGGSFATYSSYNDSGYFTAETLEIKGDFTQKNTNYSNNFVASGTHKTIFSGSGAQKISLENPGNSTFNELDMETASKIVFSSVVAARKLKGLHKAEGAPISLINTIIAVDKDIAVNSGVLLSNSSIDIAGKIVSIKGDLTLQTGSVDIHGGKLEVAGSVLQTGGTININGGSLDVAGDYKLQNGNYNCWAVLKMNNEADYVKVGGSFTTYSSYNDSGYFTAGTLEIKGDFTQKNTNYSNNFVASGTHKTIFSGSGAQKISFENPGNSTFNELDMETASEIVFSTVVAARKLKGLYKAEGAPISLVNTTVVVDKNMAVNSGVFLSNSSIDLAGKTVGIKGDLTLQTGTVDIHGGKLEVAGSVLQTGGTMLINGGSLDVAGDYKLQNGNYNCWAVLKMNNESDYVKVGGNFATYSSNNDIGYFTAGTLEIKGDFTQRNTNYSNNFVASGTHKTILSGSGVQNISFENPGNSKFNQLILSKYFDSGYVFNSTQVWKTLTELIKDTESPTIPEKLGAESTTVTTVALVWEPSSDNARVRGYEIYRDDIKVGSSELPKYTDSKLQPSTNYKYRILAYDAEGNKSGYSAEIAAVTKDDNEPPSVPQNLKIKSRTENTVTLAWDPSTDNVEVKGYEVFCDDKKVGTSIKADYTDAKSASGLYTYYIKAFDAKGNYSSVSESVYFDNIAPTQPQDLTVDTVTLTSARLSWSKSTDNIDVKGYEVYRDGTKIIETESADYTDTGLKPGTTYTYTIKAFDAAGNKSLSSSQKSAATKVDSESPSVPEGLTASSVNSTSINLTWTPSKDNVEVTGYEIYRNGIKVGSPKTSSFTDAGLVPNTVYEYTVKAYDYSGNFSLISEPYKVTSAINISSNLTLSEDKTYGTIYLSGGTIDLNGYKLTVNGSLIQTGGTVNVNGGLLTIDKDYRIENNGGYVWAVLNMTNVYDYVKVGGTFSTYSYNNHTENLTAGIMEVKGDFIQRSYSYSDYRYNFSARGTHKVILSG